MFLKIVCEPKALASGSTKSNSERPEASAFGSHGVALRVFARHFLLIAAQVPDLQLTELYSRLFGGRQLAAFRPAPLDDLTRQQQEI
jgi:hypothetical protein